MKKQKQKPTGKTKCGKNFSKIIEMSRSNFSNCKNPDAVIQLCYAAVQQYSDSHNRGDCEGKVREYWLEKAANMAARSET